MAKKAEGKKAGNQAHNTPKPPKAATGAKRESRPAITIITESLTKTINKATRIAGKIEDAAMKGAFENVAKACSEALEVAKKLPADFRLGRGRVSAHFSVGQRVRLREKARETWVTALSARDLAQSGEIVKIAAKRGLVKLPSGLEQWFTLNQLEAGKAAA
jgi:hypothetical protein